MADTDFDEKNRAGLEKAKSVATDATGKKPDTDKQESTGPTEASETKTGQRDSNAASDFAEAKKKI